MRDQLYDGRGNITSDGAHGFSYDTSGQPYAIHGGATGSFVYDAHRRRVKQTLNGQTIAPAGAFYAFNRSPGSIDR